MTVILVLQPLNLDYFFNNFRLKDWSVREAYLQIAKREAEGLPHVEADLVPRDQILLPTDEELSETEIII